MAVMSKLAQQILAPVDENGMPRAISEQELGVWGTEVERLLTAIGAGQVDPSDLPPTWALASDAGAGTPNAIQATTVVPVSEAVLVVMNIAKTSGPGPVTVRFNGAGPTYTIKTNSGSDPVAGSLPAGSFVLGRPAGTTFRLLSDQASAAIVAAVEAYANEAKDARDLAVSAASAIVSEQPSRQYAINVYRPLVAPDFVRVAGYWTAGDGGGYLAKKVSSQPSHLGRFPVTLLGGSQVWYEMVDTAPSPKCFGAIGDWNGAAGYDDTASINNWILYAIAKTGTLALDNAYYRITSKITVSLPNSLSPLSLTGRGRDVGAFVFDCDNGGFDFTLNNGARLGKNTLTIRDCTFITARLSSSAGTAIKVNGQNLEGMTHPGVIVEGNLFRGQTSSLGWAGGVNLVNSTKNQVRYNDFIGQQGGAAEYTSTFISVSGDKYPTDHLIEGNYCVFVNKGIEIAGTVEGAFILNNVLVACQTGVVRSSDVNGRPLFYVIGNHISAWGTCVFCPGGVAQAIISQNVPYDMAVGTAQWVGIALTSAVEFWIESNVIACFSTGRTTIGIDLVTSGNGFVCKNLLRGISTAPMLFGISLPSSVSNTKVLDNQFKDVTNRMTGPADGANVTVKNTYGSFKGLGAITANGDYNITVNHSLGVTPNIDKTLFSVRATSGTMDLLPMQLVSVSSTQAVVKVRVQNFVSAGNVQANVYLEA
jgi:hypothetical protein